MNQPEKTFPCKFFIQVFGHGAGRTEVGRVEHCGFFVLVKVLPFDPRGMLYSATSENCERIMKSKPEDTPDWFDPDWVYDLDSGCFVARIAELHWERTQDWIDDLRKFEPLGWRFNPDVENLELVFGASAFGYVKGHLGMPLNPKEVSEISSRQ